MEFVVLGSWAAISVQGLDTLVGIVLRGKPVMFWLQSSGPQEGQMSDVGGGAGSALPPISLRISDGREDGAGAPAGRS